MGTSHKRNVNSKLDGFAIITDRIADNIVTLQFEACQNIMEQNQLETKININLVALSPVKVISQAGKALDSYIRAHPKVPHSEVLERVSLIMKEYVFCPSGGHIDIGNLCPKNMLSNGELPSNLAEMLANKSAIEKGCRAASEKGLLVLRTSKAIKCTEELLLRL